jgi:hypothetical protein
VTNFYIDLIKLFRVHVCLFLVTLNVKCSDKQFLKSLQVQIILGRVSTEVVRFCKRSVLLGSLSGGVVNRVDLSRN